MGLPLGHYISPGVEVDGFLGEDLEYFSYLESFPAIILSNILVILASNSTML